MLEGRRENNRASEGMGSGARWAVVPPGSGAPVIDDKGDGQAEKRLDGQEGNLPARRNGLAVQEGPELLSRLSDRQLEVIGEVGHAGRLLLSGEPWPERWLSR